MTFSAKRYSHIIFLLSTCFGAQALASPYINTQLIKQSSNTLYQCFNHQFQSKLKTQYADHPRLLYVQEAKYGRILKSKQYPRCMRITLWPIDDDLHYFSDAPVRISGMINVQHFMQTWQHQGKQANFKPNAAIQGLSKDPSGNWQRPYLAEAMLSYPKYDIKHNRMQYLACPMHGSHLSAIKKLHHLTIFFDHFVPWPP